MSIVPRDFFGDNRLSESFPQRIWDDFFSSDIWSPFLDNSPFSFPFSSSPRTVPCSELAVETQGSFNTRFECKEIPEAYIFIFELPDGMGKEDMKVEVAEEEDSDQSGRILRISGGDGGGRFNWKFRLSWYAKTHLMNYSMENGVLTVVVPKIEVRPRGNVRPIEISGSD
uniref:ACD-sHsps-like protein n=1 Tax=Tamarix hispida TaxID=189793 RepID=K4NS99_9CARY|nr:ACD-sHsps-like protein [Tamarix hispida]